jgi:hypothetical protein
MNMLDKNTLNLPKAEIYTTNSDDGGFMNMDKCFNCYQIPRLQHWGYMGLKKTRRHLGIASHMI